jgi:carbon storage regulator
MGLVLRRHVCEKILIGDDVVITVIEAGPQWVRLHVEAPRSVAVDRAEVRARKLAAAAEGGGPCHA